MLDTLLEKVLLPDSLVRLGIRRLLAKRLRAASGQASAVSSQNADLKADRLQLSAMPT